MSAPFTSSSLICTVPFTLIASGSFENVQPERFKFRFRIYGRFSSVLLKSLSMIEEPSDFFSAPSIVKSGTE